jgi:hypothetical protein
MLKEMTKAERKLTEEIIRLGNLYASYDAVLDDLLDQEAPTQILKYLQTNRDFVELEQLDQKQALARILERTSSGETLTTVKKAKKKRSQRTIHSNSKR